MALMSGIGIWPSVPFLCGGFHIIRSQTFLSSDQNVSSVLSQAVMLLPTAAHEIFFAGSWVCLELCGGNAGLLLVGTTDCSSTTTRTYLLTYSMEQSPSSEANWFCS